LDEDEYEGLIRGCEAEAHNTPAAFRGKVILMSGAAYLVLFVALIAAALALYFGFKWASSSQRIRELLIVGMAGLTLLPVFYIVLRIFFMRLQAPAGRAIRAEEAPELFAVLDRMRKTLRGPPIHHVLIDRRFNAAISQVPRWGLFGGHTNYLVLGLPYLLAVTPKEMLAVVAHEYGHLCGNHGKLSAWIYRQRRTFGALRDQIDSGVEDSFIYAGLAAALDRFAPYYNAYTFVLSRQNEYDADRTATELAGAGPNASGLIRGELLGRWMVDQFWPKFYKQAETKPQPLFKPFSSMRTAFSASYDQWATQDRLAAAWREKSDLHDTHPCLRERVDATGQSKALPLPVDVTAAQALLGPVAKRLADEFDREWWQEEKKPWEARYHYCVRSGERLQALSLQPLKGLPLHDLQELALLKAEFESPQASKPVLEHLLRQPGGPFPKPAYFYGRILLDENNHRGLDYLAEAARDRTLLEKVAHIGYYYLLEKSSEEAAQAWWKKVMQ
jgi:Zn-dependent protease with chaperone function